MNSMAFAVRRAVVGVLAVTGAWYAWVGASVLLNLNAVTERWTLLSGDPDFPADAPIFRNYIGVAAILWILLGGATAYLSFRAVTGHQVRRLTWTAITVAIILLHIPWLLYRHIGTGRLPRPEAAAATWAAARQFLVVAIIYVAGWFATWHWPRRRVVLPDQ